ncbi:MAG: ketoacyl-ACP synthase III [Bacteroidales bacterium]|nr:ketoacyl-ACP synthase III [Bacteroidales bacterium]
MSTAIYSVITGSGSFIPESNIKNSDFLNHEFFEINGEKIQKDNSEIIDKFLEITTIETRRHVKNDMKTSDIAFLAAEKALVAANVDKEELDYIILAHNFGDVSPTNKQVDIVPSLAARVKEKLKIENPFCVAYDLPFGCPGWLQGLIQADYFIKSGDAKKILVIGGEILSRVSDPHDRDSMLYADGAGAVILEGRESSVPIGIIGHKTRSDTLNHAKMLFMGPSNNPDYPKKDEYFLKMFGRRLYQYALEYVPSLIKLSLDEHKMDIKDVNKVLIHQANGKMDDAILERLFKLYDIPATEIPKHTMPMTISWLGNTSVATLPTLWDLLMRNEIASSEITPGKTIVFASVGAGMNINTVIYKIPE